MVGGNSFIIMDCYGMMESLNMGFQMEKIVLCIKRKGLLPMMGRLFVERLKRGSCGIRIFKGVFVMEDLCVLFERFFIQAIFLL